MEVYKGVEERLPHSVFNHFELKSITLLESKAKAKERNMMCKVGMPKVVIMALTVAMAMVMEGCAARNTLHHLVGDEFRHAFVNMTAGGGEAVCYEDESSGIHDGVLCNSVSVRGSECHNAWLYIQLEAKNVSPQGGDASETVSLFWTPPATAASSPAESEKKQLIYSTSLDGVKKGAAEPFIFTINMCKQLALVGTDGVLRVPEGSHLFTVGEASHALNVAISRH